MLHSLGRVLNQVRSQPNWKSLRQLDALRDLWPQVVGEAVAAQTFPVKLQRQVLHVAVSTPAWGQNLSYQRQLILKKLNPYVDTPIRDIRFAPNAWQHARQTQRDRAIPAGINAALHTAYPPQTQPVKPPPDNAAEAFQRWAERVKQAQKDFPRCPSCFRHAPTAELDLWYVCGHCRMQQQLPGASSPASRPSSASKPSPPPVTTQPVSETSQARPERPKPAIKLRQPSVESRSSAEVKSPEVKPPDSISRPRCHRP